MVTNKRREGVEKQKESINFAKPLVISLKGSFAFQMSKNSFLVTRYNARSDMFTFSSISVLSI